jgi:hypothetical protein
MTRLSLGTFARRLRRRTTTGARYRLRLGRLAKRQLPPGHELRSINLGSCPDAVLDVFLPKIFRACKEAVTRPDTVPDGEMREIRARDPVGRDIRTFIGKKSFVVDMMPEARQVLKWARQDGTFRELRVIPVITPRKPRSPHRHRRRRCFAAARSTG